MTLSATCCDVSDSVARIGAKNDIIFIKQRRLGFMKFSDKLKKIRKDNNITQEQLADKIFVTRTAISKWETDMGYPSIESLRQLSKLFSITIDDLISDEDINNKVLLDNKKRRKYYYIAVGFAVIAMMFTLIAYFAKIKYLNIGGVICMVGYVVFAILQQPKEKKLNAKKALLPYIITRVIILAIIIIVMITTIIKM